MTLVRSAVAAALAATSASALSVHPLAAIRPAPSTSKSTCLRLGDRDDISDYGREKQSSELDTLVSKRDQIRKAKLANTKPDDDAPKLDAMSDEEIQAMFAKKEKSSEEGGEGGGDAGMDIDDLFSKDYVPDFKTRRAGGGRGLSSGEAGKELRDPDAEEEEAEKAAMFVDWEEDYEDENEFHIVNRIGVSTAEWGSAKAGFSSGKLKKKDRRAGKFNKTDLKKAYEKLQQNGISFVEASESNPLAEAFLQKFMDECDHGDNAKGPLVASAFPNPWKHALKSKSLPRRGAGAVVSAAEAACDRMGVSSMALYQVNNPWYYLGGSNALAEGLLDVISDDHARYVGCVDWSASRLAKLQRKLRAQGEFVATAQFDFSLTNRKNAGMIEACKKLGITPVCTNVLDGGLATGKYTSTNPTGGEVSKGEGDTGPYAVRKLEKLDALFRAQSGLIDKVNGRIGDRLMKIESGQAPRINRDITSTQIAINYIRAKGAVPLVPVDNVKMANELLGCLGWDLSDEDVEELDKACKSCGL
ncbi:hypothetical protein ACHAXT_010500 [Thalassiosira profunda]